MSRDNPLRSQPVGARASRSAGSGIILLVVVAAASIPSPPDPKLVDQRVYLHRVSWEDYEALLRARGESSAVRITYLEGTVELMAPSRYHERDKKRLARLLEVWAEERGVELEGYGSWTVKSEEDERGAEADECYVVGPHDPDAIEHPDIAIEVVWTSGGIDKLEVWRLLGAREVWFWENGALSFHALRGDVYEEVPRSEILPELDPALLVEQMGARSQSDAIRGLRAALRSRNG